MKKILFVGSNINYIIFVKIFNKICSDNNIEAKLVEAQEFINEHFLNYDAIYMYKSFTNNSYIKEKTSNVYIKNDDQIIGFDMKFRALEKLFELKKIKIKNSKILLLETNEYFDSLYRLLKIKGAEKIYIATIFQNNSIKLEKGDYFSNYLDIEKLNDLDLLVNLTNIGDIYSLNNTPLSFNSNVFAKNVLDINVLPLETAFLKKYKFKGSNTIKGIELLVLEIVYLFVSTYGVKFPTLEYIESILEFIENEINLNLKIELEEKNLEFKELMKG